MDLLVRGLREVFVPEPNGVERLRGDGANDVVCRLTQRVTGLRRRDRDGDDDASRVFLAQCRDADPHAGAGREAVVNENHGPAGDIGERSIAAVLALTPVELALLGLSDTLYIAVAQAKLRNHRRIDELYAAARNRPHCELLVARNAELADDEHVEWYVEGPSDFERNRNTTARQREHQNVRATSVIR
jgi:hypothetical protein